MGKLSTYRMSEGRETRKYHQFMKGGRVRHKQQEVLVGKALLHREGHIKCSSDAILAFYSFSH